MVVIARLPYAACIFATLSLAPSLAAAAEEGSGGMPQLDASTYPSQLFWLAVTFVTLYFAMRKLALPRISQALEARRNRIDDDLEKAAAYREEAEAAMAAYEQALADAAAQAQTLQRQTAQEIAQQASERRSALAARLADDTKAAEERIAAAKAPALANLQEVAVEVVQEVAAKLAGLKVSKTDAKAAVDTAFKEATR